MIRIAQTAALLCSALLLLSCANVAKQGQPPATAELDVGILIFGDSGYHPDYPDQDDYDDLFTTEEFLASEWKDWVEDHRPQDEFAARPYSVSPVTGGVIAETGMQGIARAMREYCADQSRCDFGVLVGDNIYPSGATLGADGIDDAKRFKDMLQDPFGKLVTTPPDYRTYVALGNHDWETSRAGGFAQIEYLESAPGFYMDGPYYTVKPAGGNGDVELFVIDTSMILASVPIRKDQLNPDGSEGSPGEYEEPDYFVQPLTDDEKNQPAWLEQALRESDARWKIVVAHHPFWSSSGSKFEQARVLRELLLPAMCRYADAYIVGHEHTLEIHEDDCSAALGEATDKPLVQILSGAASKQRPLHTSFMQYQEATYPEQKTVFAEGLIWGFSHLAIQGDQARVVMLAVPNSDGANSKPVFEYEFERRSGTQR